MGDSFVLAHLQGALSSLFIVQSAVRHSIASHLSLTFSFLTNSLMNFSSLAILLLSLGCLLSIAPVLGKPAEEEAEEEGDEEAEDEEEGKLWKTALVSMGFDQHLLKRQFQSSHVFPELCHVCAIYEFAGCVTDDDTDYLGHDIDEIMERMEPYTVANQQACATLTGEKEGASFWTYRDSDKKCWLKSSKAGKKEHTGLVSGNIECGKFLTSSLVLLNYFANFLFPTKG